MGYKNVCFSCKKAQNVIIDYQNLRESICPDCSKLMKLLPHRFRPPKKQDEAKWKIVEYLVNHGFEYQHIYDDEIINTYVPYPETIREAKAFVLKYKDQIIND